MLTPQRFSLLMLPAVAVVAACERSGPCAAYDRAAENHKEGAAIRYCVGRRGRAQGPYTCRRDDGLGSVDGTFKDGKKVGRWTFRGAGDLVLRTEQWMDDRRGEVVETGADQPPLPTDVRLIDCDSWVIRRNPDYRPPPREPR